MFTMLPLYEGNNCSEEEERKKEGGSKVKEALHVFKGDTNSFAKLLGRGVKTGTLAVDAEVHWGNKKDGILQLSECL